MKDYIKHPQSYQALRQTTYQRYQLELTWDALGAVFVSIIDKLV